MSTATDLMAELKTNGVTLWREGDALRLNAPAGTMTNATLARIKSHKTDLLALLAANDTKAPTTVWRHHRRRPEGMPADGVASGVSCNG